MKNFDSKWQNCAEHARKATPRVAGAPYGLAKRVLARVRAEAAAPVPLLGDAWGRLTLRLLAAAIPVLALCLFLEAKHLRGAPPLESGLENTVAQLVWRL
jgi:hypothetical protein